MTLQEIQDKVNIASLYAIEKTSEQLSLMRKGCGSMKEVNGLKRLIRALTFQLNAEVIDKDTLSLYKCLINALGGFGATYTIDPNVVIPGKEIIIIDEGLYNDGKIPFNTDILTLADYQSIYYPLYGNNPNIAVYTGAGGVYTQDTGTVPTITYVDGNISLGIEEITFSFPFPTQGYIQISGKQPLL